MQRYTSVGCAAMYLISANMREFARALFIGQDQTPGFRCGNMSLPSTARGFLPRHDLRQKAPPLNCTDFKTMIRNATAHDLEQILALNLAFEHYLSGLTAERLGQLHAKAAYHRVAVRDGRVAAFLLAFRESTAYDSPNYRWFAARYPQFLYIDRVVVHADFQGQGLGRLFYEDLFNFAAGSGVTRITCEYDLEPPNEASAQFHRRLGFAEVGRQQVGHGNKMVSLQMRGNPPPRPVLLDGDGPSQEMAMASARPS